MTRTVTNYDHHFTVEGAIEIAREAECTCDRWDRTDRCEFCIGWANILREIRDDELTRREGPQ